MSTPAPARRCAPRAFDPAGPPPGELLSTFFAAALVFLAAGAGVAAAYAGTGAPRLRWLALHLLLLGGVSQLVLGAGQFFTCAFLATAPPSRATMRLQLVLFDAGVVLVAVGVMTRIAPLSDAGGVLVAAGLVLFAVALRGMERRSLRQARWAVRWYKAAAASLGAGALLGVAMARGVAWTAGSLLGAHLALNVAGWLGTAIVGTLHTFFPSLTQTRLRFERLQGATYGLWLAGVAALALGAALDSDGAVIFGWLALAAGATLLSANVLASLRAAPGPLSLPARLVTLAQLFLPAGVLLALAATASSAGAAPLHAPVRGALAVLLLAGWIGLTVAGSLLHLLGVLARISEAAAAPPAPRPARDGLLVGAAGLGVGTLALAHAPGLGGLTRPGVALTVALFAALALRVCALARRAFAGAGRPVRAGQLRGRL